LFAHSKAALVADFRRAQILRAARVSFAKHGLRATTVAQIARAARLAKGTLYLYYRSKDAIVRDALDQGLAALQQVTLPAIAEPGPIDRRLRRFLAAMLAYFDEQRDFFELCQLELGADMRRRARQVFGAVYAAQIDAWTAAFRNADLGPQAADPRHAAQLVVAFAHGLALQRVRGWTRAALEDDVQQGSALLWKGLQPQ